jgi:tellurite resistance protein
MAREFLDERRKALEDQFFAQEDQRKLDGLRRRQKALERKQALRENSGISDEAVLDQLAEAELGPEGLEALALIPLVVIAWADGKVEPAERRAVLGAAKEAGGVQPETLHALESWLETPPRRELIEAWRGYIEALGQTLDATSRAAVKREILERARAVARAGGSFLGFGGTVSTAEEEALADIERAFG